LVELGDEELWALMRGNLETMLQTLLGTKVALSDEQALGVLAAMGVAERHVVVLRCAGLTAEGAAARDGLKLSRVHALTIAGLRQAIGRLWPDGFPLHPAGDGDGGGVPAGMSCAAAEERL
jgi:hypothetical protein